MCLFTRRHNNFTSNIYVFNSDEKCKRIFYVLQNGISLSKTVLLPNFVVLYFQTMFEAWHNSALSAGYMQKFLSKMQREMAQLEAQELTPPGWRVIWNRYSG